LPTQVRGLVLDGIDGPSYLAASLSMVVELLEGQVNTAATNGVHWGTRSVLIPTLSHFLLLKAKPELLESGCNANPTEDEADALWTQVCTGSNLLASSVPSSVARGPPDGVGE
jgi:hypothetical protein